MKPRNVCACACTHTCAPAHTRTPATSLHCLCCEPLPSTCGGTRYYSISKNPSLYPFTINFKTTLMPTHTSKFQEFFKLKCCICCSIYVFLNHLIRVKMWYLLSSYLSVSSTKILSIVPQSLFPHKPCDFHCAILYSTVIFRNTSHYRIDCTWLFYPRIEPILQD